MSARGLYRWVVRQLRDELPVELKALFATAYKTGMGIAIQWPAG